LTRFHILTRAIALNFIIMIPMVMVNVNIEAMPFHESLTNDLDCRNGSAHDMYKTVLKFMIATLLRSQQLARCASRLAATAATYGMYARVSLAGRVTTMKLS
jgi:hypothetical protein